MDTTDTPPKPSDPTWTEWAEAQLNEGDYDPDLGQRLAVDARKVAQGELSKSEFHERHTEAVEQEFGFDERPTKRTTQKDASEGSSLPKVPDTRNRSRRRVLEAIGALGAGGASGLAGCLEIVPSDEPKGAPEDRGIIDRIGDEESEDEGIIDEIPHQVQLGMVVDTERCVACLQCSLACKEENDTDVGVHWPYVFRYEDVHAGGTREGYLNRLCQHCSEPSCTYVCPTQARYKRTDDGIVLTDYDRCIGCRYCQVACPYGVNYLGQAEPNESISDGFDGDPIGRDGRWVGGPPPRGVMGKCTLCVHRQDSDDPDLRGTTACEQRCPFNALHFGDLNDPNSAPRKHLREKADSNQFRLLEEAGTSPNSIFIGEPPSQHAAPIEGPVAYEDHGMRDGDYEYHNGGGGH